MKNSPAAHRPRLIIWMMAPCMPATFSENSPSMTTPTWLTLA